MVRRGATGVFRKNTLPVRSHPRPRYVDLYFFHTHILLFLHHSVVISCSAARVNVGLANFEIKTRAESKIKLVLWLFAQVCTL